MLISNALLAVKQELKLWFWSSRHSKNLSSQFFDLGIENTLGGATLAKIESSLYDIYYREPLVTFG